MNADAAGIPNFQTLMLPVLLDAAGGEVRIGATIERLADAFSLTPDQRAQLLPSKRQTTFANRVHWAKSYLRMAGLVTLTKRGHFAITELGQNVLANPPDRIDIAYLGQFPEFQTLRAVTAREEEDQPTPGASTPDDPLTPDERMRAARDQIEADLAQDMLARSPRPRRNFLKSSLSGCLPRWAMAVR